VGKPIRVLIADDHPMVRQGLRTFLELYEDVAVVGEARDGEETVDVARALSPDVILLDLVMPRMDGLEALELLRREGIQARVVVLTSFADDQRALRAILGGAVGFLTKDVQPQDLYRAVVGAALGEPQLHPKVAMRLVQAVAGRAQPPSDAAQAPGGPGQTGLLEALTQRERQVLGLLAEGKSNKEIAAALYISEKTVKTHVSNILHKLGVADRTQAALFAVRHGLNG